jgi:HEAT repeat protein
MAAWATASDFVERMGVVVPASAGHCRFVHAMVRDYFAFVEAERALRDERPEMRDAAAWALWALPDRRSVNALIVTLDDPYEYARGSAAAALGRIGDPRAMPALKRLASDPTNVVSRYGQTVGEVARWAIRSIQNPMADE